MIHHTQRHRGKALSSQRLQDESQPANLSDRRLTLDFDKRLFVVRGKLVHLGPKEVAVLRELVASRGRPISHQRLLQTVWGPEYKNEIELLRVVVYELRKKIEHNPAKPKYIQTEPRIGYRFALSRNAYVDGSHE